MVDIVVIGKMCVLNEIQDFIHLKKEETVKLIQIVSSGFVTTCVCLKCKIKRDNIYFAEFFF